MSGSGVPCRAQDGGLQQLLDRIQTVRIRRRIGDLDLAAFDGNSFRFSGGIADTTKNEIGIPFRGSLSHFFVEAVFIRRCVPVHPSGWPSRSAWCLLHDAVLRRQALHAGGRNSAA